jgi:hypothetical protein
VLQVRQLFPLSVVPLALRLSKEAEERTLVILSEAKDPALAAEALVVA